MFKEETMRRPEDGEGREAGPRASERLIWLMAVTAGTVVANNYYNQPLLKDMSGEFAVSEQAASWISSLTQIGYALGLLLLLPLCDRIDRRRMISVMLCLSAAALVCFSLAGSYALLLGFGFLIGLTSIVPQILPPVASEMAAPGRGADAVGKVMAGLLLGIVLSRFVGGWVGHLVGWRVLYAMAAGVMIVLMIVLRASLPRSTPSFHGSYGALMASLLDLVMAHGRLRSLSLAAALQFGAFSLFWTTLAFFLASLPGHYPASVAGSFALVGAVGVLSALLAGRVLRQFSGRQVLGTSGLLMLAAFPLFLLSLRGGIGWLVPAVILLDLGMQVSHVTSMSSILAIDPTSRSRLNTVYMVTRFAGGALGTLAGGVAWAQGGWPAVCLVGALMALLALAINLAGARTPERV